MTTSLSPLAEYLLNAGAVAAPPKYQHISTFASQHYYIPDKEPPQPIQLMPHQIAILEYALGPDSPFTTVVFSTVKKSGKTSIAGLVGRWAAETWGRYGEIYSIANDLEQARGRIYQKIVESIELTPGYDHHRRELPDKWRVLDKECTHLPSGTKVKALSGDYKGEAGSNPTLTLWTELWGYTAEASRRLWDEMTPVPTRRKSVRFVETYAGYEDESDLLLDLYNLAHKKEDGGYRIDLPGWPYDDPSPCYVNPQAGLFAYWDEGPVARRMPWQTPEYYAKQAKNLRPNAFDRLHNNYWTSSASSLLPIEWWDANLEPNLDLRPLDPREPCVIGLDASVSNDCTGIVLVTRHPTRPRTVAIRKEKAWFPTSTHKMNFNEPGGLRDTLIDWCKNYNVVEIAYDAYQLHHLMQELTQEGVAWCRAFGQGVERNKADKQFHDLIRDNSLPHGDLPTLREHLRAAGAKSAKDEDTKFRIVKKSDRAKIDLVICGAMATYEALRLNLDPMRD